jgi:GNAT superfamily N-acetyltransferase
MSGDIDLTKTVAYSLIQKIDSGEANLFLEHSNTNTDGFVYKFFDDGDNVGVFVSFPYFDVLRVQISFRDDTESYSDIVSDLLRKSFAESGLKKAFVWIQNENRSIIDGLQNRIEFNKKGRNNSHYASVEYIMPRGHVDKHAGRMLEIQQYDEDQIDTYLRMLDDSMDFVDSPPAYMQRREDYKKKFSKLQTLDSFEAFWKDEELVGLYWRSEAEIDVLAVTQKWQRKGFGTDILSRAIEVIMNKTDAPFAYLYCVDWNEKGQSFYEKYGMVKNGHSYGLSIG